MDAFDHVLLEPGSPSGERWQDDDIRFGRHLDAREDLMFRP